MNYAIFLPILHAIIVENDKRKLDKFSKILYYFVFSGFLITCLLLFFALIVAILAFLYFGSSEVIYWILNQLD